jgi:T-complex protein 1 subunit theta
LSTIVLRGSTTNILEDIERAIDDAVHVFRSLIRYPEFVPGAGSTEIVFLI